MENASPTPWRRPLKAGLSLPETESRRGPGVAPWPERRAVAETAEAVGFDLPWLVDHGLFPAGGDFVGFTIEQAHGG